MYPLPEVEQALPRPAQVRRDRFPPKPMTPEAALARLRRREKKILYDQIRERKRAKGLSGPTAGNRETEDPVGAGDKGRP
jgi:hypothetical protein